ncbi:hypothetical protein SY83_08095 [Paenibacillus swuensis]|uniref:HTH araC/xylS-type domain-containing protein n=1 Tax=Paenibacillus swuensis TaxID=1178515 RepID=A0A172TPF4_9BACL|nr:hypothetical protein SY83_08095 [Paenibacillus swuensis]
MRPVVPYIREGDYASRKPWFYPERRLLDYLLVYVQEGSCCFRVDEEDYLLHAGEFCLVQPNSLVRLEGLTDTVTPFVHMDIFYHPDRAQSFPTRPGQIHLSDYGDLLQPRLAEVFGVHVPVRFRVREPRSFKEKLLRIIDLFHEHNPLMQLKVQTLATELVTEILELYSQPGDSLGTATHTLNWVPSYMSFHLRESISVADLARRAHLSVSRFNTLFKERFHTPPHQYLLRMRIQHAQELLQRTLLTQEQIAEYCGFADVHHFSKAFKKRTGTQPGEWTKTRKQDRDI